MRTIIDLPGAQLEGLDAVCRRDEISRAEAVRRAVAAFIAREQGAGAAAAFGLWRGRPVDALRHERRLRREWDRPRRRR